MKRITAVIALLFLLAGFSGCAYMNIKTPYDTDLDQTSLGSKVGKASNQSILWLVAWGDGGTEAAAKNGDLSVINHMDRELLVILFGIYARETTIVYGD